MPTKQSVKQSTFDDLVKQPEAALSIPEEQAPTAPAQTVYTTAPVFDMEEIQFPRLRLAQGLTPEVSDGAARPGQWLVIGGDPVASVTVVPIAFARRRVLRQGDERLVVCQSGDGVHGQGMYGYGSAANPSGSCALCPKSHWGADPSGGTKGVPPSCTLVFSYIVYLPEHDRTCSLEFSRSAEPVAKQLNTLIQGYGGRMANFAVTLASAQNKGQRGVFYTPTIQFTRVEPEDLERAREAQSSLTSIVSPATDETDSE